MPRANGLTRQEILQAIKYRGAMTADDLSRALGISQVAVRQHLAALEAEDIITINIERRGLGRPSHRYLLTPGGDETFPRRYEALANSLLDELNAWQGEAAVTRLLARRRERAFAHLAPHLCDKPLGAKVKEIARAQSEQGFMAEIRETAPGDYRLYKRNCAVCAVARNHPSVCCAGDLPLLQALLEEADVSQEQTILAGDPVCTFRICARVLPDTASVETPLNGPDGHEADDRTAEPRMRRSGDRVLLTSSAD